MSIRSERYSCEFTAQIWEHWKNSTAMWFMIHPSAQFLPFWSKYPKIDLVTPNWIGILPDPGQLSIKSQVDSLKTFWVSKPNQSYISGFNLIAAKKVALSCRNGCLQTDRWADRQMDRLLVHVCIHKCKLRLRRWWWASIRVGTTIWMIMVNVPWIISRGLLNFLFHLTTPNLLGQAVYMEVWGWGKLMYWDTSLLSFNDERVSYSDHKQRDLAWIFLLRGWRT